jgi:uncharacterized protein VirK/YbjX
LLRPFLRLAREKKTRLPAILARALWRVLTNIGTLDGIVRILKLPPYFEAARSDPIFACKYLSTDYLVRGLTVAERAACFTHHYMRIHAVLPDRLLRHTLYGSVTLHEIPDAGDRFSLTMGSPRPFDREGEMSVNLVVDGKVVFVLSFAIIPGWVVKAEAAEVLLITRIQGQKGAYSEINRATKTLHDVAPASLLLAALQGVANAIGIPEFAGVCAINQPCFSAEHAAEFHNAYDDFFAELGMAKNAAGFFLSPLPIEDKPLYRIKQGHKLRTREKRAFKQQIAQAVCGALHQQIAAVDAEPLIAGFPDRIPDVLES